MAEKEEQNERKEIQVFLQLLTIESDDMEVPPIYLTAFQYSSIVLFKTESCAFLKGLLKISDFLQTPNAFSFPESSPLPVIAAE